MRTRQEYGGLVWIDLESPNRLEVRAMAEEFGIAETIAEELLLPASKPRAEFYGEYAYIVMHFPALKHSHATREQEVDFIVGKNFLITTHYDTIDPIHKFSKIFEVNATLETTSLGEHAGFLFFFTVKKLYKAIEYELDFIRRELITIEEHIYSGHEVEMVSAISRAARGLLNLRQTIEPHRDILKIIEDNGSDFFGAEFLPYLRGLSNEYYRVHNHITRATDFLHELRETNNSLLTTKQNETMRILTIMALLTFPLALLVTIFDINSKSNPLTDLPYGFWIIVGIVVAAGSGMVWYFKHNKWL